MNMCRHHQIDIWKIKKDGDTEFCVQQKAFKKLVPIARKSGVKPHICKKKGLELFIYYLLDFFFTTYRKIFSGVLWAKPPNVDVLAYPTRAGHTEKKTPV